MAFVSKSERTLKFKPNFGQALPFTDQSTTCVGPGSYLGQEQYKIKPSNAPFSSASPREVGEPIRNNVPGPGEYKSNLGFDSLNESNSSVMKNILLRFSKNRPPFNSNSRRFDPNQSTMSLVGPGQYNTQSEKTAWIKTNQNLNILRSQSQLRQQAKSSYNDLLTNKHHSPPSIPSGDFIYGYKVEDDGHHVISLKTVEKEHSGEKYKSSTTALGPGAYHNVDGVVKNRGGVLSYQVDTSSRSRIELSQQSKVVGPGSYDITKPIQIPLYKYNPNQNMSMFASQTKRQTSLELKPPVKRMSKLKRKLQRFTSQLSRNPEESENNFQSNTSLLQSRRNLTQLSKYRDYADEDDDEDFLNEQEDTVNDKLVPGPGAYMGQDQLTSFKPPQKPPQFQFFGSSADRFEERRNLERLLKEKLGPGCYQTDLKLREGKPLTFKTVGFNSEIDRFYVRDQKIPGPGFYKRTEQGLQALKNVRSYNKSQTAFGAQQKRFVIRDTKVPGPGEYKPERSINALDNKKHEILPKSSVFQASATIRQISNPILDQSPPVGSYDPERSFMALNKSIIKADSKENSPNRNLLSLRSKSKEPPAFNIESSRFEDSAASKDKKSPIRGPGYYDYHEMTQLQPKRGNFDYFTQTKRFEHGSYLDRSKTKLPGPGQYRGQNEGGIQAKNKSFNLMFN